MRSGREFAVADDLRIIGYRTFCPHGVKVYLNARIGPSGKRGRRERDYPVFGSYLFVGAPAGFVLTRDSHPHVYAVVENCGTRDIPASFIEMASEMWVSGRWDGRGQASTDIQPSDRVRVSLGRLGELEAVVDSLPTETHAIIRFAMFGKTHTRRVDIERLEMV